MVLILVLLVEILIAVENAGIIHIVVGPREIQHIQEVQIVET